MSRFGDFTDDEVYMLKRMAMESSYEIVMTGNYSEEEIALYNKLLNEVTDEDTKRLYTK